VRRVVYEVTSATMKVKSEANANSSVVLSVEAVEDVVLMSSSRSAVKTERKLPHEAVRRVVYEVISATMKVKSEANANSLVVLNVVAAVDVVLMSISRRETLR